MSLTNSGFDGTVTERDFSRIMRGVGVRDSVETVAAWAVTQGAGRQVSVAPGVAYAAGVVSDSGLAILADLPTPTNGQWHLVVRRITWANNSVTVATIPHTTTTTTIPTAPPAGFPVFNDNTGVLVDQHLAWAWVRSTDTAVAVFDLRNVQGVQRTSVVVADFTALALLPAGVRFVGEQAFVVEGDVYMSWSGTLWRQVTMATFATTGARDTSYAKAAAAFRVLRAEALVTGSGATFRWSGSAWSALSAFFRGSITTSKTVPALIRWGTSGTVTFDSVTDPQGGFTAATGQYTCPGSGRYVVTVQAKNNTTGIAGLSVGVQRNGVVVAQSPDFTTASFGGTSLAVTLDCVVGDLLGVFSTQIYTSQADAYDNNFVQYVLVT